MYALNVWKSLWTEVHHRIHHPHLRSALGASQSPPVESPSMFLSPVYQSVRSMVCLICCPSSRGLHAVQELHRRPYAQINPIYQHRKGKGNMVQSLKWNQSSVTSFKYTAGNATLYHLYSSHFKALPMHLAYVWIWNWICLCGKSNRQQAWAKAHCTGETKTSPHLK